MVASSENKTNDDHITCVAGLKNGVSRSIGNGKMIVEFFSAEMLLKVCRYLN